MKKLGTITSEYVGVGHPDKMCDLISDTILDMYLAKDELARVAVETMVKDDKIIIAGEITSSADISKEMIEEEITKTVRHIGYGYVPKIFNYIGSQSLDIALGTNEEIGGAGDQGIMFGYATSETDEFMPLEHQMTKDILSQVKTKYFGIYGPDMKSQVTCDYTKNKISLKCVVVSVMHKTETSIEQVRNDIQEVIDGVVKKYNKVDTTEFSTYINPTGRFVIGGPFGDSGVTGRKIVVDNYGANAQVGGGAYSGKDPTKVDRSAAYMARLISKNIVASGICDECLIQFAYVIGKKEPTSVKIEMKKDGEEVEPSIEAKVLKLVTEEYDLSPKGIITYLKLRQPIYKDTVLNGHYGLNMEKAMWEKLSPSFIDKLQNI